MYEHKQERFSFANPQELEQFIRAFKSYSGPEIYDFGSVVGFLIASLDNLRELALEAELEDIGEYMTPEQITMLLKIVSYLEKAPNNR